MKLAQTMVYTLLAAAFALATLGAELVCLAQAAPTDERLLKELDADLLQGLPAPPGAKSSGPKSNDGKANDEPPARPAAESPDSESATDPLQRIAQRMRSVEERIGKKDLSLDTRGLQKEIVDDLAALIEQAKKRGAAKKGPGKPGSGSPQAGPDGGNPTPAPASDSTDRVEKGQADRVETAEMKDALQRIWGHLPEKLREELQNSLSEQFLPKYEKLIEEYYKRLAEERPGRP